MSTFNLYLLTQTENTGYDTFDSCIVAAKDENEARTIHPSRNPENWGDDTWCSSPEKVTVTLLGTATNEVSFGVVLSSFCAS